MIVLLGVDRAPARAQAAPFEHPACRVAFRIGAATRVAQAAPDDAPLVISLADSFARGEAGLPDDGMSFA